MAHHTHLQVLALMVLQTDLFIATANQTTFSGADDNGDTLTYDVASGTAFADIYLNGVKLAPSDFTATNGTSIVLASGASVNDILQVVSYGTFSLQNQDASTILQQVHYQ